MTSDNRKKAAERHIGKARAALDDATVLLAAGRSDAAVSRAYYCCFHAARAALASVGVQPKTHKGANERFNLDLVVPGLLEAEYLSTLGRLQTHREAADYGLEAGVSEQAAKEDVEKARLFLARMEQLLGSGS